MRDNLQRSRLFQTLYLACGTVEADRCERSRRSHVSTHVSSLRIAQSSTC